MKAILLLLSASFLWAQAIPFPGPGMTHASYQTLARTFPGNSSNVMSSANAVDLTSTRIVSLSFWMYWDNFANDDLFAMEQSANYTSNVGAFLIDPDSAGGGGAGKFEFDVNTNGASTRLLCWMTRPSAATWHHYLLIWDITTATGTCAAYIDGSVQSVTTTHEASEVGHAFGSFTLYFMSRNNTSLFGKGRLSEIAIWKSALTSGNATTLAACGAANSVDSGNLLYYWPINQTSPEVATTGGVNLTVVGTTNSNGGCIR